MSATRLRVAIVGAGPSGAGAATLLATAGADVVLFEANRRPPLVVGESLIPAVIPILRRLGVEEEVAAISALKPGVGFFWPGLHVAFDFGQWGRMMPPYAYNIPRPAFDDVLRDRARRVGVRVVERQARFVVGASAGSEIHLDEMSAAETGWAAPPHLVINASGRGRELGRVIDVGGRAGPRDDVAHFSHFAPYRWEERAGIVMIGRVDGGWSWRIPLRDCVSVGVVLDRAVAGALGATPEARLAAAIAAAPDLVRTLGGAARVSPVVTYSNYQFVTGRAVGPGWVAIGDAFGFVDPMLSPGVALALRSAEMVADALAPAVRAPDTGFAEAERRLGEYAARWSQVLSAWMELVAYLYDGRMLAAVRAGTDLVAEHDNSLTRWLQRHIEQEITRMVSGMGTTSAYSRWLLRQVTTRGLRGVHPDRFAIR